VCNEHAYGGFVAHSTSKVPRAGHDLPNAFFFHPPEVGSYRQGRVPSPGNETRRVRRLAFRQRAEQPVSHVPESRQDVGVFV
jgi:hypothetical protein